jgi:hypothetical protein
MTDARTVGCDLRPVAFAQLDDGVRQSRFDRNKPPVSCVNSLPLDVTAAEVTCGSCGIVTMMGETTLYGA